MKIKFNTNLFVNVVIIIYAVLLAGLFFPFTYTHSSSGPGEGDISSYTTNALRPIDENVPDSISHHQYIKLKDSIRIIRGLKNGDGFGGEGDISFGFIGTGGGILCDTCGLKWYRDQRFRDETHQQYYIKLPFWKLKNANYEWYFNDSVKFFVLNRQSYIRKEVIDKSVKSKNGSINNRIHLTDIPVKFKYDEQTQCLMIPVSKQAKHVTQIGLYIFLYIFLAYYLYLVALFLKLVFDISKGLVFTAKNLFRLKIISISLLVLPVAVFLFNLFMKLIFHSYFTSDVMMSDDVWKNSLETIIKGIVFLLLFKAFRLGKLLKEEQDLTV